MVLEWAFSHTRLSVSVLTLWTSRFAIESHNAMSVKIFEASSCCFIQDYKFDHCFYYWLKNRVDLTRINANRAFDLKLLLETSSSACVVNIKKEHNAFEHVLCSRHRWFQSMIRRRLVLIAASRSVDPDVHMIVYSNQILHSWMTAYKDAIMHMVINLWTLLAIYLDVFLEN